MIAKNTVIGFLIFTAVLLTCVLILQNTIAPAPAQAGTAARAGRFAVATASFSETTDLLWVANVDNQMLTVYRTDKRGIIEEYGSLDLEMIFQSQPIRPARRLPVRPRDQTPRPETETKTTPGTPSSPSDKPNNTGN